MNVNTNGTGNFTNSSVVASGYLKITAGGTYTFRIASDDQGILYIDGVAVLSEAATGGGAAIGDSGLASVTLAAGLHSIAYKETNQGSGGGYRVLYSGPDTASNGLTGGFQTIASSNLYSTNAAPTAANGYNGAAIINNDYTLAANTSANIDTFGTQFGAVANSITLGANSQLTIANGPTGSLGLGWFGIASNGATATTTIQGTGVIFNTGNTATQGAGTLNLIGIITDGGFGLTKTGTGSLILGRQQHRHLHRYALDRAERLMWFSTIPERVACYERHHHPFGERQLHNGAHSRIRRRHHHHPCGFGYGQHPRPAAGHGNFRRRHCHRHLCGVHHRHHQRDDFTRDHRGPVRRL